MKRVRINEGNVGLIYRFGDYKSVITAGSHWISPFDDIQVFDMSKPMKFTVKLTMALKDENLTSLVKVVEVLDNEIILMYKDNLFEGVLSPGKYAYWIGLVEYKFTRADLSKVEIIEDIDVNTLMKAAVLKYVCSFKVESYEEGLLYKDGKFDKILTSGTYYFWNNSTQLKLEKVDKRQISMEVTGQEILTKDKAQLRVNFQAQYKVVDIEKALLENKGFEKQLYTFIQLSLRELIGTLTLDELLDRKESVDEYVLSNVKQRAKELGVKVMDCGIKDVILPGEVKDIMNQVLVAQKRAQANIITRREETASTRSLLNTAKLMEDNDMLFKLKEMEYVEKIAEKINSISLSGGSQVVDQLKAIFTPNK